MGTTTIGYIGVTLFSRLSHLPLNARCLFLQFAAASASRDWLGPFQRLQVWTHNHIPGELKIMFSGFGV